MGFGISKELHEKLTVIANKILKNDLSENDLVAKDVADFLDFLIEICKKSGAIKQHLHDKRISVDALVNFKGMLLR